MFLRTDANSTTSNDHNVLCGLEALLPLRHELTNIGVALWVVDGTSPLGPSRQHEDCEAGDQLVIVITVVKIDVLRYGRTSPPTN
jgi:hypothetical protein